MNSNILKLKKGMLEMNRKIRAKFSHGIIEPMENLKLPEGSELFITISKSLTKKDKISEDDRWGTLSNSSFAKDWDNNKDAIYDNWEKQYNVQ